MSNLNMSVPSSIFEGKFSTYIFGMCLSLALSPAVGHREIYFKRNIIKYFVCVEFCILLEKWNIYEAQILPKSLVETCWLETTSLCLNTRLRIRKNFQILIILTEIYLIVCLLFAHSLMISIFFHTQRPNTQETVGYLLDLYVSSNIHFSHFEELKSTFFTSLHFAPRVMYLNVSVVWMSVIVYRTEINAKSSLSCVRYLKYSIWITGIHLQINLWIFILNLCFIWVLVI